MEILSSLQKNRAGLIANGVVWVLFLLLTLFPLSSCWLYRILMGLGIAMSLVQIAVRYDAMKSSRVLIRIDPTGILNASHWLALGKIPWERIDRIRLRRRGNQVLICLDGPMLKELALKKRGFQRILIRFNHLVGLGWDHLVCFYSEADPEMLMQAMIPFQKDRGKVE